VGKISVEINAEIYVDDMYTNRALGLVQERYAFASDAWSARLENRRQGRIHSLVS
jgi:hypothetical protein